MIIFCMIILAQNWIFYNAENEHKMTSKNGKHETFRFCQIDRIGRFRPSELAELWVNQFFGVFQVLGHILFVVRLVAIFLWIVDLFSTFLKGRKSMFWQKFLRW